ncbi:polysaccharide deacetylase [Desulfuribacillus stibiiarsenatis]|uniref:Polysaccharide deacetylase n=1 Tax=Desulfuribacillus stibiiarsenatis TaxID=1390249 RepID=A0A1E5LA38_9FIRM|nr:polysaccharide deacetylase family protein [Desulfuribacillus stibiiarsenatis]OEH86982.1 polysaccharide deacetylase [Desulfuribacillus stibiiarsenatis]
MRKYLIFLLSFLFVLTGVFYTGFKVSSSRTFQLSGELIHKVDTTEKVVALTFDDGPTKNTGEVLDILKALDVKATFFVTGREIEENMDEAKRIVLEEHELGNHSYSHQRMVLKTPSFIEEEIDRTNALIREAGYQGTIHFRPPYGKKLLVLPMVLNNKGIKTIMWDIEPETYPEIAADSKEIIKHVVERIQPGSIILLHVMYESRRESMESIAGIVTELQAQGYAFKTVSELIE